MRSLSALRRRLAALAKRLPPRRLLIGINHVIVDRDTASAEGHSFIFHEGPVASSGEITFKVIDTAVEDYE
jgi:hypothetical protein